MSKCFNKLYIHCQKQENNTFPYRMSITSGGSVLWEILYILISSVSHLLSCRYSFHVLPYSVTFELPRKHDCAIMFVTAKVTHHSQRTAGSWTNGRMQHYIIAIFRVLFSSLPLSRCLMFVLHSFNTLVTRFSFVLGCRNEIKLRERGVVRSNSDNKSFITCSAEVHLKCFELNSQ